MTNDESKELLPDSKLDMLVRDEAMIVTQLVRSMAAHGDEVRPMLVLLAKTETGMERVVVAMQGMKPGMDKHSYLRMIGESIAREIKTVIAAVFIGEAWSSEVSPAEAWRAKHGSLQPPSKRPNRVEVVSVSLRTLDGRGASAMANIVGKGEQRSAGEWKFTSPSDYAKGEDNLLGNFFKGYVEELGS